MPESASASAVGAIDRDAILARVQELLQRILELESPASIGPDARLQDDLNFDSLGMVDFVLGVEESFGIKMRSDLDLLERVVTVGDAVDLIAELSAAQSS